MDAAFSLINRCITISPSLFGYLSIFGMIGVGKTGWTTLMLIIAHINLYRTFLGINSGIIPWDK